MIFNSESEMAKNETEISHFHSPEQTQQRVLRYRLELPKISALISYINADLLRILSADDQNSTFQTFVIMMRLQKAKNFTYKGQRNLLLSDVCEHFFPVVHQESLSEDLVYMREKRTGQANLLCHLFRRSVGGNRMEEQYQIRLWRRTLVKLR